MQVSSYRLYTGFRKANSSHLNLSLLNKELTDRLSYLLYKYQLSIYNYTNITQLVCFGSVLCVIWLLCFYPDAGSLTNVGCMKVSLLLCSHFLNLNPCEQQWPRHLSVLWYVDGPGSLLPSCSPYPHLLLWDFGPIAREQQLLSGLGYVLLFFHPHKGGYLAQSAILKTLMSLSLLPKASVSCEHDNFPIPYYFELLIYKLEKKTRELLCTSLFSLMSVERPVGLGQVPLKSAVPIPLPAMLPSSHLSQAFPLSLPPRACQNQRWRLLHLVTSSSVRWQELPVCCTCWGNTALPLVRNCPSDRQWPRLNRSGFVWTPDLLWPLTWVSAQLRHQKQN